MDIYSYDRTDEFIKSQSNQRCIFGEYRMNGRKGEEVSFDMGWRVLCNYLEDVLCQPRVYT
jgi:hypothetical protein